jgi:hypothetical protein
LFEGVAFFLSWFPGAEQQSVVVADGIAAGLFTVFSEKKDERAESIPGHDISVEYPRFVSSSRPTAAKELSEVFAGRAAQAVINASD